MSTVIGQTRDSGAGEGGWDHSQITVKYLVLMDSFDDDVIDATSVSGIPPYLTEYPGDSLLRVRNTKGERVSGAKDPLWIVTVEYTSPPGGEKGAGQEATEITAERPTFSLNPAWHDIPAFKYSTGRTPIAPITNSAQWIFSPPFMTRVWNPQIEIVQNFNLDSDLLQENLSAFQMTVNDSTYLGFPARSLLCTLVKPITEVRDHEEFMKVHFFFEAMYPDWDIHPIDYGPFYRPASGPLAGKKVSFLTADGFPEGLGFLDGSGDKSDTPVVLTAIQRYMSSDFSALPLTTDMSKYIYV